MARSPRGGSLIPTTTSVEDPRTTLFSGYTVLCGAAGGSVEGAKHGLFHRDTRVLCRHDLRIGDEVPTVVRSVQPESDRAVAILEIARLGGHADGPLLPQDALDIQLDRRVGPGLLESVQVTNRSLVPYRSSLRIGLDADFADLAELGREREQEGRVARRVDDATATLELRYTVEANGRTDERGVRIRVVDSTTPAQIRSDGLSFELDLATQASWAATIAVEVLDDGRWAGPPTGAEPARRSTQRDAWRERRPTIDAPARLRDPFERAADDLFGLRNWELEDQLIGRRDGSRWVVNAGVPMFTGLFGRDVITAGWQSAMLGPRALAGALDAVAGTQATEDDAWRDAEPGKLIHELRSGPLAALGLTPRDAYYGSQTTPALYVLALSELWHWTGDDRLLHEHLDVARRAMAWAIDVGDLDGDGFLEYRARSPRGLRNQAWKDSNEAIRDAAGTISEGPIATVEEQAFFLLALERMAEICIALGEDDEAAAHLDRARALRTRWHESFWMPDEGFYAMALDGEKRQVRSIGSNPGHALGAGMVPVELAERVADRLLAPDLFSGWGVRSLSSSHPSYNPFAYHLGSVWPVEQATFALGFKRYGLDRHLDCLVDAVFDAAIASPDGRLPEALTGHARRDVPMPVPYPAANVPQAWSASALVQLVQILLGLYPFAPLRVLAVVRPRLPAWVPELTVRGLRVGRASVDLRFRRRDDGSATWAVVRRHGPLLVLGAGPPNDVGPRRSVERLELAVLDRAPARLARAARIALGRG
jgi:glycogen debranching enzyme